MRIIIKNITKFLKREEWNTTISKDGIFYRIYSPLYVILLFKKLGFGLIDAYNVRNGRLAKLPLLLKWIGWYLVLIFKKKR